MGADPTVRGRVRVLLVGGESVEAEALAAHVWRAAERRSAERGGHNAAPIMVVTPLWPV